MRDVVVIGAGPAGLMAARDLAASGHDVVVLEEHPAVGVPVHCTGLLGLDAFDELELPRATILGITRSARFFGADGRSVLIASDRVKAAVVDRARFDQALAAASAAAGAEVRPGMPVRTVTVQPGSVRVEAGEVLVEARVCILACGANYRFNRALGLGVPSRFVCSAQLEVPLEGPGEIEVHLGRDVAPGGFAWVVPFSRDGEPHARIGVMCDDAAGKRFDTFQQQIRRRFVATDDGWPAPRVRMLPLAPVRRTSGARLLAVGDAAGLVKPTTGGGIYYSLLSGRMAARVLDGALRENTLGESAMRAYDAAWSARLSAEIRTGLAFRSLVSRLNDRAIDALVELARVDGIVPLLERTADFNWHASSALALLRHAQFRRILLGSLWN